MLCARVIAPLHPPSYLYNSIKKEHQYHRAVTWSNRTKSRGQSRHSTAAVNPPVFPAESPKKVNNEDV